MATSLENAVFGFGTTETLHAAYELEKERYKAAAKKHNIKDCDYHGKRMDIIHKAWCLLSEHDQEQPPVTVNAWDEKTGKYAGEIELIKIKNEVHHGKFHPKPTDQ